MSLSERGYDMYNYPIALTQQFKMCGNCFRIDTYKGCDFNCRYCFASNRGGNFSNKKDVADFNLIKKLFSNAFDSNRAFKNITNELLRKRVPLHLGGLSDPFQERENKYKITYEFLKLSNLYKYPVMISTKTNSNIPWDEYFKILNPDLHCFQISLIGMEDLFIRKFENNTELPEKRLNFIKRLKSLGFWVSVRIQPLIDINEAIRVIKSCENYINYITVEHLKISLDNKEIKDFLLNATNTDKNNYVATGREYELPTDIKLLNIQKLKSITQIPIGCGDNDLHMYSDSNNCCGIDVVNKNFDNWLKYNSMYLMKTGDYLQWYPSFNVSSTFNSSCRKPDWSYKDYVDDYLKKFKEKYDI
jgi:DNA repair photolyase